MPLVYFEKAVQYNTIQSFYSHYSGTKVKKKRKNENTRNYRKLIDRNYITIFTIFESVCNSQSSKAFELAAAYLQVKKGTNERNIFVTKASKLDVLSFYRGCLKELNLTMNKTCMMLSQ